jgi:hypothetical protein
MFSFKKKPAGPPALTSLDVKVYELEMRILGMEQAIVELCHHLKDHLDRIDHNTVMLDKNMHNLASMTLRSPKDLLDGGQEIN